VAFAEGFEIIKGIKHKGIKQVEVKTVGFPTKAVYLTWTAMSLGLITLAKINPSDLEYFEQYHSPRDPYKDAFDGFLNCIYPPRKWCDPYRKGYGYEIQY